METERCGTALPARRRARRLCWRAGSSSALLGLSVAGCDGEVSGAAGASAGHAGVVASGGTSAARPGGGAAAVASVGAGAGSGGGSVGAAGSSSASPGGGGSPLGAAGTGEASAGTGGRPVLSAGGGGAAPGGSGGSGGSVEAVAGAPAMAGSAGSAPGGSPSAGATNRAGAGGQGNAEGGSSGTGGTASAGAGGAAGAAGAPGDGGSPTCLNSGAPLARAWVPEGFCAWQWAGDLDAPRGITVDDAGDALVVERGAGQITLLSDDDGDGVIGAGESFPIAQVRGLNHGLLVTATELYASTGSSVYRWDYVPGARAELGSPTTVVSGIPSDGHDTRTLVMDEQQRLYVSVGSRGNVDGDSSRARILRYTQQELDGGATFASGELFADGLRNEVGLVFDTRGRLWGIENGLDELNRADLGGDIHTDNPGEELNLFEEPGLFYGYPYCWSEYSLPDGVGRGPNTQWLHPRFDGTAPYSDAWCQEPSNVVPPVMSLQPHSAPLDLLFYTGRSFPADYQGDLLVPFHGSWNRRPATGYKVVRVPFGADGTPSGEVLPLFEYAGSGDTETDWQHRPVALAVLSSGLLLITSDASGLVIAVGYGTE